jgi:hypothetical protein
MNKATQSFQQCISSLRSLRLCEKTDVKPPASVGLSARRKHAATVRLSRNQCSLTDIKRPRSLEELLDTVSDYLT